MINSIENNEDLYNLEFLAREYFEMHKIKCDKCQKYRVECAFSPHCPDRKHLNILIQLQTLKDDRLFPSFCYSLYVKNVKDFLMGKGTFTSSNDSWIYLEDFLSLYPKELKKSKKKDEKSLFFDVLVAWKKEGFPIMLEKDYENKDEFSIIFKDTVYRIMLPIKAIIVDVNQRVCYTDDELESYIHLLCNYYELNPVVELIKDTKLLWYLKFSSKGNDLGRIKDKLEKYSYFFNIYEKENGNEILVDIKTSAYKFSERKRQNYQALRNMFKLFKETLPLK